MGGKMQIQSFCRELFTTCTASAPQAVLPVSDHSGAGLESIENNIFSLLREVQRERNPSVVLVYNWHDRLIALLPFLESQNGPYPLWIRRLIREAAPTEAIESISYLLKLAKTEERVLSPTAVESEVGRHLREALSAPASSLFQLAQQLVWTTKDFLPQKTGRSHLSENDQKRSTLWWMKQAYPLLLERFPSEEEELHRLGLCIIQNRERGLHHLVEWMYGKLSEQHSFNRAGEEEPDFWNGLTDCLFRITQKKQEEALGALYGHMKLDQMSEREGLRYSSYEEALEKEREILVRGNIDSFSEGINRWVDQYFQRGYQRWALHALINHVGIPLAHRIARGYSKKILGQLCARASDQKKLDQSVIDLLQKARQWIIQDQVRIEEGEREFWQQTFLWIVDEATEQLLPQEISETQRSVEEWSNRPSSLKGIRQGVAKTINVILGISQWVLIQELYLFSFFLKKGVVFLGLDKKMGDIANAQVRDIVRDPSIQFKLYNTLSDLTERMTNAEAWPLLYLVPESLPSSYSNSFEDFVTTFYHSMMGIDRQLVREAMINRLCRSIFPYFYIALHNQRGCLNWILLSLMREANLYARNARTGMDGTMIGGGVTLDDGRNAEPGVGEMKAARAKRIFGNRLEEAIQHTLNQAVYNAAHNLSNPTTTQRKLVDYLFSQLTQREGVLDCSLNIIERFGVTIDDERCFEARATLGEDIVVMLRSELFTLVQSIQKQLIDLAQREDWQGSELQMRVTPLLVSLNDMIEKSLDPQASESMLCTLVNDLEHLFQRSGLIEWRERMKPGMAEKLLDSFRERTSPLLRLGNNIVGKTIKEVGIKRVGECDREMHNMVCQTIEKGLVYLSQPHCVTDMLSKVKSLQLFS